MRSKVKHFGYLGVFPDIQGVPTNRNGNQSKFHSGGPYVIFSKEKTKVVGNLFMVSHLPLRWEKFDLHFDLFFVRFFFLFGCIHSIFYILFGFNLYVDYILHCFSNELIISTCISSANMNQNFHLIFKKCYWLL